MPERHEGMEDVGGKPADGAKAPGVDESKNKLAGQGDGGDAGEAKPEVKPGAEGDEAGKEAKPEGGEAPAGEAEGGKAAEGEGKPAAGEKGAPAKPEAKPKESIDARMREMTAARRKAEQEAEDTRTQLRQALDAIERLGGGKAAPKGEAKPEDAKPNAPEFDGDLPKYQRDMAAYTEKLVEWTTKERLKVSFAEQERVRVEESRKTHAENVRAQFKARRDAALERLPDYETIAENQDLPITDAMAAGITAEENGPDIAYWLGQNIAEADRISKLAPGQQLIAIGRIAERLDVTRKAAPKKEKDLPPPIKPQGAGASRAKDPTADDASMEEYVAANKARAPAAAAR